MRLKCLDRWEVASGNGVSLALTVGGPDAPKCLTIRCEWEHPPSAEDAGECRLRVQQGIGEALAILLGGRVVTMNAEEAPNA
jgi:hypothetical protein